MNETTRTVSESACFDNVRTYYTHTRARARTCIHARIYNTYITIEESFVEESSIVNNRIESVNCILYAEYKNEITSAYVPFDQSCGVLWNRLIRSIPLHDASLYIFTKCILIIIIHHSQNVCTPGDVKSVYILALGVRAEGLKGNSTIDIWTFSWEKDPRVTCFPLFGVFRRKARIMITI